MARDLPPDVWFVRSNGGSGSYPIRPEGWKVVRHFILGMFGSGIVAALVGVVGSVWGPLWLVYIAPLVFAGGAAYAGWNFIATTRRHTDYGVTYSDYVKDKNNA